MVTELRPARGGFLRPFGCAQFILEFLKGLGLHGSRRINPTVGSPMVDIFAEYKDALHRAWAEDMVATEEERRVRRRIGLFTLEERERRFAYYMERIPMKFTRARYASFTRYFGHLKRLGWVEETGKTEPSGLQDSYPAAPSRVYYRISAAGRAANPIDVMNPIRALYAYPAEYFREKRKGHHYLKR